MSSGVNDATEYDTAESWEAARNYSSLLGEVPNSFSTLVRGLVHDVEVARATGSGAATPLKVELSEASRFQLMRLLKGPSVRAVVYYAALSFFPERLSQGETVSDRDLATLFDPLHLAALIATIYLYRTARKRNKPKEWRYLAEQIQPRVDIGAYLGAAIPNISPYRGLFTGGLPFIAQATFLKHDAKGFIEYRRLLKRNGTTLDPSFEMHRWGCTTIQIASILLQSVGFGVTIPANFTRGLVARVPRYSLDPEGYRFKIAECWIEALLASGKPPDIAHKGDVYPLAHDLERLVSMAAEVRRSGCKYPWLEKGKDISTEEPATPADEDE